jgi:hypothetical protein
VRSHHVTDGGCVGVIAEEPQGLGGATLHQWIRVAQRGQERGASRLTPNLAERERTHLSNVGFLVGQQRNERLHGLGQTDAAERKRRAPPNTRLGVTEQANQV